MPDTLRQKPAVPVISRRRYLEMTVEEAITDGIAYMPRALSEPGLGRLRQLQARAVYRQENIGEVALLQPAEIAKHADLLHLDQELELAVRNLTETDYSYDQAILKRYPSKISTEPAKEARNYQKLVWIFVLTGKLRIEAFTGEQVSKEWDCRGGDLLLLRGPGFRGREQERIRHSFITDESDASTLTLRMDEDADPWDLDSEADAAG